MIWLCSNHYRIVNEGIIIGEIQVRLNFTKVKDYALGIHSARRAFDLVALDFYVQELLDHIDEAVIKNRED